MSVSFLYRAEQPRNKLQISGAHAQWSSQSKPKNWEGMLPLTKCTLWAEYDPEWAQEKNVYDLDKGFHTEQLHIALYSVPMKSLENKVNLINTKYFLPHQQNVHVQTYVIIVSLDTLLYIDMYM